jgi:hypothetical protein
LRKEKKRGEEKMDDLRSKGIFVEVKIEGESKPRTIIPLILRFDGRPIFQFIPSYVIDESVVDDVQKVTSITISDNDDSSHHEQSMKVIYYVFLMNRIDRPRDLIYTGNTTIKERTITKRKGNFTDIILIPEDILIRLSFPQLVNPFFLIKEEDWVDEAKVHELFKVGLFIHDMFGFNPELYFGRKRIYFNLSRWELFFSKKFRMEVEMRSAGIAIENISSMYTQKFSEGEAIFVELPHFNRVRDYDMALLCKHVYMGLLPGSDVVDDEIIYTTAKRYKPVRFTALLSNCGWIEIVSIRY